MERNGFTGKAGERIIELFLVWTASTGLTLAISSFFSINLSVGKVLFWIFVWSAGIFAATRFVKWKYFILTAAFLVWLIRLCRNWKSIEEEQDLLYVMFLAVLIIAVSVFLYRSNIVMIIITVLFVAAMLHYDQYPDHRMLLLWLSSVLALKTMGKSGGGRRAFWTFFGCLLLMAFLNERISVPVAAQLHEHTQDVRYFQQKLNLQWEGFLRGLDNHTNINGKLDNAAPANSEDVDIIVSVAEMPKTNLYFRGYIGAEYTSDDWKVISDSAFRYAADNWELGDAADIQARLLSAGYDQITDFTARQKLVIQNAGYGGDYALVPYCSKINRQQNLVADGLIKSSGAVEFVYDCYFLTNPVISENVLYRDELERDYTEYVRKMYLGDWQKLVNLTKLCENYSGTSFLEAENFIRSYLTGNCFYSKELDPLPYGVDYAEFFMFTEKKGYCAHFATAGTLMFRALGYPARYAAGYVVKPENFVKDGPGYMAEITGNNAHAWVEVYLNGVWYPVEMTPGYFATAIRYAQDFSEDRNVFDDEEEEEDEEDDSDETEDEDEEEDDEEDQSETFGEPEFDLDLESVSGILAESVAILAFVCLILYLRRRMTVLFYYLTYQKGENGKAVLLMARRAFSMAKAAGYGRRNLTDVCMAEKIGQEDFSLLVEIAQKAKYSKHRIGDEEKQACYDGYRRVENYFYSHLSKWQRIIWKYVWCFR